MSGENQKIVVEDADKAIAATKAATNKILDQLNELAESTGSAAAVLTLQLVAAAVLASFGVPTDLFAAKVDDSRKELFGC